jgi:hypothetical protein
MSRVVNSDSSIDGTLYALEKDGDTRRAAFIAPNGSPTAFAPKWQEVSHTLYCELAEAARPYALPGAQHSRDWSYIYQCYDVGAQARDFAGDAALLRDLAGIEAEFAELGDYEATVEAASSRGQ